MATHLLDCEWQLSQWQRRDKQMQIEKGEQRAGNIKKKEREAERHKHGKREGEILKENREKLKLIWKEREGGTGRVRAVRTEF